MDRSECPMSWPGILAYLSVAVDGTIHLTVPRGLLLKKANDVSTGRVVGEIIEQWDSIPRPLPPNARVVVPARVSVTPDSPSH